jgi:hypothetical protein
MFWNSINHAKARQLPNAKIAACPNFTANEMRAALI